MKEKKSFKEFDGKGGFKVKCTSNYCKIRILFE